MNTSIVPRLAALPNHLISPLVWVCPRRTPQSWISPQSWIVWVCPRRSPSATAPPHVSRTTWAPHPFSPRPPPNTSSGNIRPGLLRTHRPAPSRPWSPCPRRSVRIILHNKVAGATWLLNRGVPHLTNPLAAKWGGRLLPKLLLPFALTSHCQHRRRGRRTLLRERLCSTKP